MQDDNGLVFARLVQVVFLGECRLGLGNGNSYEFTLSSSHSLTSKANLSRTTRLLRVGSIQVKMLARLPNRHTKV